MGERGNDDGSSIPSMRIPDQLTIEGSSLHESEPGARAYYNDEIHQRMLNNRRLILAHGGSRQGQFAIQHTTYNEPESLDDLRANTAQITTTSQLVFDTNIRSGGFDQSGQPGYIEEIRKNLSEAKDLQRDLHEFHTGFSGSERLKQKLRKINSDFRRIINQLGKRCDGQFAPFDELPEDWLEHSRCLVEKLDELNQITMGISNDQFGPDTFLAKLDEIHFCVLQSRPDQGSSSGDRQSEISEATDEMVPLTRDKQQSIESWIDVGSKSQTSRTSYQSQAPEDEQSVSTSSSWRGKRPNPRKSTSSGENDRVTVTSRSSRGSYNPKQPVTENAGSVASCSRSSRRHNESEKPTPKVFNVMLIGDTRVGKTSFVNTVSGQREWKKVGSDNGESTTIEVAECCVELKADLWMTILDSPGMNDSKLRLTNKDIRRNLEYYLSSTLTTAVDAFLIFESLRSEAVTLRRNLKTLVQTFGEDVKKSCIVLLTKEPESSTRCESLIKLCGDLHLPYVFWENTHQSTDNEDWVDIDNTKLQMQIQNLLEALGRIHKYEMTSLRKLKDEILKEAERQREAEEKKYEVVNLDIEVPYLEKEERVAKKTVPVLKERWKSGIWKPLGFKEYHVVNKEVMETETHYHEKRRQETRQEQVEVPKKPIEFYIEAVRKEKVKAFRMQIVKSTQ